VATTFASRPSPTPAVPRPLAAARSDPAETLPGEPADDAGSVSEDDGFGQVDIDPLFEAPEPQVLPDRGCPNGLGWSGNIYTEDPQYGVFPPGLDDQEDITAHKAIFLAVLGDAGDRIRLPRSEGLHGCAVTSVVFSEAEVLGYGVKEGTLTLLEESAGTEVKYLILVPDGSSFQRAPGNRAPRDIVKHGYDSDVRRCMSQWVDQLPDWKVLAVVPANSTWFEHFAPAARKATTWASWHEKGYLADARVRARHWITTPAAEESAAGPFETKVTTASPRSPRAAAPTRAPWSTLAASIVADLLRADLQRVTQLTARVADAVADVRLSNAGKVQRHVVRGPPLRFVY